MRSHGCTRCQCRVAHRTTTCLVTRRVRLRLPRARLTRQPARAVTHAPPFSFGAAGVCHHPPRPQAAELLNGASEQGHLEAVSATIAPYILVLACCCHTALRILQLAADRRRSRIDGASLDCSHHGSSRRTTRRGRCGQTRRSARHRILPTRFARIPCSPSASKKVSVHGLTVRTADGRPVSSRLPPHPTYSVRWPLDTHMHHRRWSQWLRSKPCCIIQWQCSNFAW